MSLIPPTDIGSPLELAAELNRLALAVRGMGTPDVIRQINADGDDSLVKMAVHRYQSAIEDAEDALVRAYGWCLMIRSPGS